MRRAHVDDGGTGDVCALILLRLSERSPEKSGGGPIPSLATVILKDLSISAPGRNHKFWDL